MTFIVPNQCVHIILYWIISDHIWVSIVIDIVPCRTVSWGCLREQSTHVWMVWLKASKLSKLMLSTLIATNKLLIKYIRGPHGILIQCENTEIMQSDSVCQNPVCILRMQWCIGMILVFDIDPIDKHQPLANNATWTVISSLCLSNIFKQLNLALLHADSQMGLQKRFSRLGSTLLWM